MTTDASVPHIRNLLGLPQSTLGASVAYWDSLESSTTKASEFIHAYNTVANQQGLAVILDPARPLITQLVAFQAQLNRGVADAMHVVGRKLDREAMSAQPGLSDMAIDNLMERHRAELENPRFIAQMVDDRLLKLSQDQFQQLQELEERYADNVEGAVEHGLNAHDIESIERDQAPEELVQRVRRAGGDLQRMRDFYRAWGEFMAGMSPRQIGHMDDYLDHHTHEALKCINALMKREMSKGSKLSAQVTGVMRQLQREMEQGRIGVEEALHVMEHVQGQSHDAGRVFLPATGGITGLGAKRGELAEAGVDAQALRALLQKRADRSIDEKEEEELEGLLESTQEAAEAEADRPAGAPGVTGAMLKAKKAVRGAQTFGALNKLIASTFSSPGDLADLQVDEEIVDADGADDEDAQFDDLKARFVAKLDARIGALGTFGLAPTAQQKPSRGAPVVSDRETAQRRSRGQALWGDQPEKVDLKTGIAHHPQGTKEFHPRSPEDVTSARKLIKGEGQLFEVDLQLGKMKPVNPADMVPGRKYIWVPASGGGFHVPPTLRKPKKLTTGGGFGGVHALMGGQLKGKRHRHRARKGGAITLSTTLPPGASSIPLDLSTLFPEELQTIMDQTPGVLKRKSNEESQARVKAEKAATQRMLASGTSDFVKNQIASNQARDDAESAKRLAAVGGGFGGALSRALPPGSKGTEGSTKHEVVARPGGGSLGSLMEKNAWKLNDRVSQFSHVSGLRDKSLNQHHNSHHYKAKRIPYNPHGHHRTQKVGGGFWSTLAAPFEAIGDATISGAKAIGTAVSDLVTDPVGTIEGVARDFVHKVDTTARLADRELKHVGFEAEQDFSAAGQRAATFFGDPSLANLEETFRGLGDIGEAAVKALAGGTVAVEKFLDTTPAAAQALMIAKRIFPGLSQGLVVVNTINAAEEGAQGLELAKFAAGAAAKKLAGVATDKIGGIGGSLSGTRAATGGSFMATAGFGKSFMPGFSKGIVGLHSPAVNRVRALA